MYVRPGGGFMPTFPVFAKIDVNGPKEHPLYTHLKSVCPPVKMEIGDKSKLYWDVIKIGDITWNFEKFLLGADGRPFKRFDPQVEPEALASDIEFLIAEKNRMLERHYRN